MNETRDDDGTVDFFDDPKTDHDDLKRTVPVTASLNTAFNGKIASEHSGVSSSGSLIQTRSRGDKTHDHAQPHSSSSEDEPMKDRSDAAKVPPLAPSHSLRSARHRQHYTSSHHTTAADSNTAGHQISEATQNNVLKDVKFLEEVRQLARAKEDHVDLRLLFEAVLELDHRLGETDVENTTARRTGGAEERRSREPRRRHSFSMTNYNRENTWGYPNPLPSVHTRTGLRGTGTSFDALPTMTSRGARLAGLSHQQSTTTASVSSGTDSYTVRSLSTDRVRHIEHENRRLLRRILEEASPDKQNKTSKKLEPPVRNLTPSAVNRIYELRRIERDNLKLLQRLQSVRPTMGLTREEQMRDWERLYKGFGVSLYVAGLGPHGVIPAYLRRRRRAAARQVSETAESSPALKGQRSQTQA